MNEHLTLSQLSATSFGRTRLGKTGFQIEGSNLIQLIMEDRLRHASGPVHTSLIRYIYRACHKKVSSSILGLAMSHCFSIRIPGTFFGEPEGVPQDFF